MRPSVAPLLLAVACAPGPTITLGTNTDAAPARPSRPPRPDAQPRSNDAFAPDIVVDDAADAGLAPDTLGARCAISVTPSALDFCAPPGEAVQLALAVSNHGTSDCILVRYDVGTAPAFAVTSGAPTNIPSGGTITLTVSYVPIDPSGDSGTLTLSFSDLDAPDLSVPLTGSTAAGAVGCIPRPDAGTQPLTDGGPDGDGGVGVGPDSGVNICPMTVTPALIQLCGTPGNTVSHAITVTNPGPSFCDVSSATMVTSSSELTLDVAPVPQRVAPGASAIAATVSYQPTDFVDDQGLITVTAGSQSRNVVVEARRAGVAGCP